MAPSSPKVAEGLLPTLQTWQTLQARVEGLADGGIAVETDQPMNDNLAFQTEIITLPKQTVSLNRKQDPQVALKCRAWGN